MLPRLALSAVLAWGAVACASAISPQAPRTSPDPATTGSVVPVADEILRRAEAIRNPEVARAMEVEISSVLPDATAPARQASYSVAATDAANSLALRQSDDDMRGATLLMSGDRTWTLRPGAGTREAYEFRGAQVRLGDWVVLRIAGLDLRAGWQTRLVGEERYGDELCYKLELTLAGSTSAWSRLLYWVGKADFRPRRIEGYSAGMLVSMIRYEGFAEGPWGVFARRIVVEGATPREEIHSATFSDLRPLACDPASVTLEGMLALKDAARARGVMTRHAPRVRIEELLPPPAPQ